MDFRLHIPDIRFGRRVNSCKFTGYPLPDGRGLLGSGFPQRAVWAEAHPTDSYRVSRIAGWVLIELDVGEDELDVAGAVVIIDLRLIGDVEELAIEQLLLQLAHPKAYAASRSDAVGYRKL